ncbi:PHP domain-containing protein, partial [Thiolapillus sp.]
MNNNNTLVCFEEGSQWLRADFHLHTKADKEFSYQDNDNEFVRRYVEALKQAGIGVGVITNHNKFNVDEFKALRKRARKESILLLPGVELSVNDGSNGVHVLIVFSESWLDNGNDYVSPFITTMFPGKSPEEYENENARSDKNILQVVEELEKT